MFRSKLVLAIFLYSCCIIQPSSAISTSAMPFFHGVPGSLSSPRYYYGSPVMLERSGRASPIIRVTSTRRGRLLAPGGLHPNEAALLHFSSLDHAMEHAGDRARASIDHTGDDGINSLLDARAYDYVDSSDPALYETFDVPGPTHFDVLEVPSSSRHDHMEVPGPSHHNHIETPSPAPPSPPPAPAPAPYQQQDLVEYPEHASQNESLSADDFSQILRSFQLDALRATQLAERYGLLREGAGAHLGRMLGGAHASPTEEGAVALPLTDTSNNFIRPLDAPLPPPADFPQISLDEDPSSSDQRADHLYRAPGTSRLSTETARFFRGSQDMCYSGTCEFFMRCWMAGGAIEQGCGGFLFACCSQPGRSASSGPVANNLYGDERSVGPLEYGPVINEPGCGLPETARMATSRVVGGTEAGFGSFPWQAYIRIGSSRCGGSLINRNHVVTAGHCVARARASQIRVTLGDYVLNSDQEPLRERVYRATAIKVHPRFKFTPQADRYDVAVIRLDVAVHYQPHIQPICLPQKGTDFLGQYGWAAGWGALKAGSRVRPKTLQTVDVPVIDSQRCENWHRQKGINVIIHPEMMCAGYTNGGKDSCQGDSGGPLNMEIGGRWYLSGIVSAGYSCARGRQPGIYHRVAYTADWISWAASD